MWIVVFMGLTVICGIGWIRNKLALMMMVTYVLKKGYKLPSDEEAKACREFVIRHIVEDMCKRFRWNKEGR